MDRRQRHRGIARLRIAPRFHNVGHRHRHNMNDWRHRPRRRVTYSHDQRQRAIGLRQQGFSYRQIAQQIGQFCSKATIFQWVRRAQQQAQAEPPQ